MRVVVSVPVVDGGVLTNVVEVKAGDEVSATNKVA